MDYFLHFLRMKNAENAFFAVIGVAPDPSTQRRRAATNQYQQHTERYFQGTLANWLGSMDILCKKAKIIHCGKLVACVMSPFLEQKCGCCRLLYCCIMILYYYRLELNIHCYTYFECFFVANPCNAANLRHFRRSLEILLFLDTLSSLRDDASRVMKCSSGVEENFLTANWPNFFWGTL